MILKPRQYQLDSIDAVTAAWDRGIMRPAVVLPTGAGKTVTFAHLIHQFMSHPDTLAHEKALVLVNRDELARQAAEKIASVVPSDLTVGIVKAEQNDTEADVVVGSVQTLLRPERREQLDHVSLVVVDECHYAVAPGYMEVLEHFGVFEATRCVGYTATMSRSDSLGLGDLWQEIVYERDTLWAIVNGFLVDVEAHSIVVDDLNLAEIARNHGDYQEGKLGDALIASGAPKIVAEAYGERCKDQQGIVFCPNVASALEFTAAFNDEGIKSVLITGETPSEERQQIYESYRLRETQVLVSVMVLTVGFDMPQCSVAVIARPTTHAGLFTQMVGRALRTFPGKSKATVLDVVGATSGKSLASLSDLSRTDVVPTQGESLLEALERSEDESANVERDVLTGKVTSKIVSLFQRSDAAWGSTYQGTWFIPTRQFYIVLKPVDGGFRIARTHSRYRARGEDAAWLTDRPMSMELCMSWGEQLAIEADPLVADKSRDWRTRRRKPTQKQFDFADRLKLKYDPKVRKHELAEMIDRHQASKVLDER